MIESMKNKIIVLKLSMNDIESELNRITEYAVDEEDKPKQVMVKEALEIKDKR